MKKRLLSVLLALVMVAALLPMTALAGTEVDAFNLVLRNPETGNYPVEAYSAPDEYSYSVSWSSLHVSSAATVWTYLDEYNVEQVIAYPETFKPETVYTVHITLQLSYGYEFADPPQITINGTAPEYETWNTYDLTYVVLKRTFAPTAPLAPITKVEVTGQEPLCGEYADGYVSCDYFEPYTVENSYWHDIYYNPLTSSDKFVAGETYTLVVELKASDSSKFTTDLTAEDCVLNPDWLGFGVHPDTFTVYSDVFARMEFYWTIPYPISFFALYTNVQAAGENPSIYAWADPDVGYEVRATRYYDELYGCYLDYSDVLEEGHNYRMEMDVYPTKGNTLASTVSGTLNGAPFTYCQNNLSFFTVYAPAPVTIPEELYEAEVTYDQPVDVGLYASDAAEVPIGQHYDIAYAVWYDAADNDIYGFDFEDGKDYTFRITLEPDMGYVFSSTAVFRYNGEVVPVTEDGRLRTISVPFHVSSWSPTVITEGVFDLGAGVPISDYTALKDTLKALASAGLVNAWEYGGVVTCDLDLNGTEDIAVGPAGLDPTKDAVTLMNTTRSCEGTKALTVNPAALDYLKAGLAPAYYESLKFILPALTWTVSFDANGGSGLMADITVPRNTAYTLPACAFDPPAGQEFDIWNYGAAGTTLTVTSDLMLTALWKDKATEYWTISFEPNGGSGTMYNEAVEKGKKYTLPPCDFTAPEGKEFDKWDLGKPGQEIDITADTELKALWKDKVIEYWTVTFDAGGGSGAMAEVKVEKGKKYTLPACTFTAPAGKEFDKWDLGKPGSEVELHDDLTLKALWKDKETGKVNPFVDVFEKDYFYDAVMWAYYAEPQVTNGMDETHFGPANTVTRGQAVTFLWRAMGCPEPTSADNPFEDVTAGKYYYKAVLWAVEKGITNGTDATHFTPNQTCSTAHIITFLYRTIEGPSKGDWYAVAEAWAKGAGLLKDLSITVAPGVDCPRRDVVLFLFRALA